MEPLEDEVPSTIITTMSSISGGRTTHLSSKTFMTDLEDGKKLMLFCLVQFFYKKQMYVIQVERITNSTHRPRKNELLFSLFFFC